jgi:signal transduction histidine kinase/CheY-like chemotaxis protein
MQAANPPRSLTRRTLIKVTIRIAIVVAIATVISYYHVKASLQNQILEQLQEYIQQRGVRESSIFQLAKDDLQIFTHAYAQRLSDQEVTNVRSQFNAFFVQGEDGVKRLREDYFERYDVTGFIGKYVSIDDRLQHQLVIGFDMLTQYGPAWQNRFANLYVITPDNAVLMYWPDQPWGLNADDWQVNAKLALTTADNDEVLITGANLTKQQGSGWSDLYFDYAVNNWVVSATEAVTVNGTTVLWAGHDILLDELIQRTINNRLEGTYNLIFRDDGRLIAHPRFMDAIQAQSGDLSIPDTNDPNLLRIFNLIKQNLDSTIIENNQDNQYLAVAHLEGPDWHLVTVFPEAIIAKQALQTARLILLLGATALVLEIAILFFVLRKLVAEPLENLLSATNRIASGDFAVNLNNQQRDEIGRLARSFHTMSREIEAREITLNERSVKLAHLNQQLAHELEERKRIEQEVSQQREALYQSEKLSALGSLLAGVAHELNNPLSIVVGRAVMLEEQLQGSAQALAAERIRNAADRCARIVKTFLAMARHQEPVRVPVQITQIIEASLDLVGYSLRSHGVEVSLDCAPDLPEFCGDANQLTQVFTNLFLNAQQAMAQQSNPQHISVVARYDTSASNIQVRVSDSGPGIAQELQPRIFDPFVTTKGIGEGTGLGLSVCHSFIQAHHGAIRVDSEVGNGTTFIIILPVGPLVTLAPADPCGNTLPNTTDRSILVIDDEPEVADVLTEILSEAGYQVVSVGNGLAALAKLTLQPFDLLLSDLRMPDMDGQVLYAELKLNWHHLAERIIFITGDTLNESVKHFLKTTDRPVIEKPFVPADVRQTVARELERLGSLPHGHHSYTVMTQEKP